MITKIFYRGRRSDGGRILYIIVCSLPDTCNGNTLEKQRIEIDEIFIGPMIIKEGPHSFLLLLSIFLIASQQFFQVAHIDIEYLFSIGLCPSEAA